MNCPNLDSWFFMEQNTNKSPAKDQGFKKKLQIIINTLLAL
jgi:hypothetical protein